MKLPNKRCASEKQKPSGGKAKKSKSDDVEENIKPSLRTYVFFLARHFKHKGEIYMAWCLKMFFYLFLAAPPKLDQGENQVREP